MSKHIIIKHTSRQGRLVSTNRTIARGVRGLGGSAHGRHLVHDSAGESWIAERRGDTGNYITLPYLTLEDN